MSLTKYILIICSALALAACGADNPDLNYGQNSSTVGTPPGNSPETGDIYTGTGVPGTGTVGANNLGAACDPTTLVHSPQSNDQFLRLAYCQFFKRYQDDAGYTYWINELNSGYPRLNLLQSFLISMEAENIYSVSTMSPSNLVTFFYSAYLGRTPDGAGLNYWVKRYASLNGDKVELAREFLSTPEPKTYWNM